jgi:hypothetical protein
MSVIANTTVLSNFAATRTVTVRNGSERAICRMMG